MSKSTKGKGKGMSKSAPTFLATGPAGVMGRGPSSPNPKQLGPGAKGSKGK